MIPPNGQPVTVFVAIPADDGHRLCFWKSILDLAMTPPPDGVTYRFMPVPGDSLIPRIRNDLLMSWYTQTADDYLLFLDTDLEFVPASVHGMVARRMAIVCGLYAKKIPHQTAWVINSLKDQPVQLDGGLYRVACGGTGAMLIHRSVVTEMIAKADWWWDEQKKWRIRFLSDVDGKTEQFHLFTHVVIDDPEEFPHSPRDMSEDWSFCYYARKLGFDVWLDTWARFLHEGAITYPLDARRLTAEEVATGLITQPDGSKTPLREDQTSVSDELEGCKTPMGEKV